MKQCPGCGVEIGEEAGACDVCRGVAASAKPRLVPLVEPAPASGWGSEAVVRRLYQQRSRTHALIGLLISLVMIWALYEDMKESKSYSIAGVLCAPVFFLLSLGGLIDPDILYGMRIKEIPTPKRVVSHALLFGGLAIGACTCYLLSFGW